MRARGIDLGRPGQPVRRLVAPVRPPSPLVRRADVRVHLPRSASPSPGSRLSAPSLRIGPRNGPSLRRHRRSRRANTRSFRTKSRSLRPTSPSVPVKAESVRTRARSVGEEHMSRARARDPVAPSEPIGPLHDSSTRDHRSSIARTDRESSESIGLVGLRAARSPNSLSDRDRVSGIPRAHEGGGRRERSARPSAGPRATLREARDLPGPGSSRPRSASPRPRRRS
jgi:hypothetical protein